MRDYEVLEKFAEPLTLGEMRADPALARWGALRGKFRGRVHTIPPDIWEYLVAQLTDNRRRAWPQGPGLAGEVTPRSVGLGQVEGYDVTSEEQEQQAVRREGELVSSYARYLRGLGSKVHAHKIRVSDNRTLIYSDLFNEVVTRRSRRRPMPRDPTCAWPSGNSATTHGSSIQPRAVPYFYPSSQTQIWDGSLQVRTSPSIAIVWAVDDRFADDAGGAFT